ncbi:MAG: hypothetical protein IT529_23710 [Burkholderiales bacterium]|nr:hypothetical protein [Burkholderiales bacterium]
MSAFVRRHRHAVSSLAILAAVLVTSEWLLGARWLLAWIDARAPVFNSASTVVHIQKQLVHMELASGRAAGSTRVAFVGSSSVVNGVDVALIRSAWRACGLDWDAQNLGAIGLLAHEVPLLKRYWSGPDTVVVYLYNSFSFADRPMTEAMAFRWDTGEGLRLLATPEWWRYRVDVSAGIAGEVLTLVRFGELYQEMFRRASRGAVPRPHSAFDFDPGREAPPARHPRVAVEALPESVRLRAAFLESQGDADTLGYRGLRRFVQLAHESGQLAVVGPVPEPEFGLWTSRYRVGTRPHEVHARVARVLDGSPVLRFEGLPQVEADDLLFLDHIHLNKAGRAFYSQYLARRVPELVARKRSADPAALACVARAAG